MSAKRMLMVFTATVLLMAGCTLSTHPADLVDGNPLVTPSPSATANPPQTPGHSPQPTAPAASAEPAVSTASQDPREYSQKKESLPKSEYLTSFPGVLESLSLTLEQMISVLGNDFELRENKAQGYDTYVFEQYGLALDFDKLSKRLAAVYLKGTPYYVNSGVFKTADLNQDGKTEKIAAYEDQAFNGCLIVWDGETNAVIGQTSLDYFGGKCTLDLVTGYGPSKETLILVKTHGGKRGEVYKWDGKGFAGVLPDKLDALASEAAATLDEDTAILFHDEKDILHVCPLPGILAGKTKSEDSDVFRYAVAVTPGMKDGQLVLKVRTGLLVKLSDNYDFLEGMEGTYCDVAQITEEYRYLGDGKWELTGISGGPKYQKGSKPVVSMDDLKIGSLCLLQEVSKSDPKLAQAIAAYESQAMDQGLLIPFDGLNIGIQSGYINYIAIEKGSGQATSKGLKINDTKEKAQSLYGLPDKGFPEDDVWTYYVLREDFSEDESSFLIDTLNIEFEGGKVCRIWVSAYVAAY